MLLELSSQNALLTRQVAELSERLAKQEERIAELERRLNRRHAQLLAAACRRTLKHVASCTTKHVARNG